MSNMLVRALNRWNFGRVPDGGWYKLRENDKTAYIKLAMFILRLCGKSGYKRPED